MIILVAAMTHNFTIGKNGGLPWKNSEEMQFFKQKTLHQTILMGSKTFESIGKPLPQRNNIVITSDPQKYDAWNNYTNLCFIKDLSQILQQYNHPTRKILVIGGAHVYAQTLKYADELWISVLEKEYDGDIKFPYIDPSLFKIKTIEPHQSFKFYIYERNK